MHRTPTATVPASNSRVLIITALITASTTVGVAFIGIFPQMRNSDAQRYGQLQQEFADFRQKAGAITAGVIVPSEKKMAVSGTVFTGPDRRQTRNGVEVYLFPGGSGGLTAKTDDNGRFTLNGVPLFPFTPPASYFMTGSAYRGRATRRCAAGTANLPACSSAPTDRSGFHPSSSSGA